MSLKIKNLALFLLLFGSSCTDQIAPQHSEPKPRLYWANPRGTNYQADYYQCMQESLASFQGNVAGDVCELNNTIYSDLVLNVCKACLRAKGYILQSGTPSDLTPRPPVTSVRNKTDSEEAYCLGADETGLSNTLSYLPNPSARTPADNKVINTITTAIESLKKDLAAKGNYLATDDVLASPLQPFMKKGAADVVKMSNDAFQQCISSCKPEEVGSAPHSEDLCLQPCVDKASDLDKRILSCL